MTNGREGNTLNGLLTNRWYFALPALLLAFAVVFAACGGDDDDDSGSDPTDTPAAGETPTEANGDDGDDGDNGSSGGGSEEEYVANLCNSLSTFETDINETLADLFTVDPDATEEEIEEIANDAIAAFANIMGEFADEVDGFDAPSDIAEYHDQMVSSFREIQETLESEDFDINSSEDPFADLEEIATPDADITAKYEAIAANEPACAGLDIFEPGVE